MTPANAQDIVDNYSATLRAVKGEQYTRLVMGGFSLLLYARARNSDLQIAMIEMLVTTACEISDGKIKIEDVTKDISGLLQATNQGKLPL